MWPIEYRPTVYITGCVCIANLGTPVGMGTGLHQVLVVTLTIFQPRGGRVDHAHPILMSPPTFESQSPSRNLYTMILGIKFIV